MSGATVRCSLLHSAFTRVLGIRTRVLLLEWQAWTEPAPQPHMATSFVFVRPYVYEGVCIAVYMGKREETVASCSTTMCQSLETRAHTGPGAC